MIEWCDTFWLTCLFTATLMGTATARPTDARAAYRRLTTAVGPTALEAGNGSRGT